MIIYEVCIEKIGQNSSYHTMPQAKGRGRPNFVPKSEKYDCNDNKLINRILEQTTIRDDSFTEGERSPT